MLWRRGGCGSDVFWLWLWDQWQDESDFFIESTLFKVSRIAWQHQRGVLQSIGLLCTLHLQIR